MCPPPFLAGPRPPSAHLPLLPVHILADLHLAWQAEEIKALVGEKQQLEADKQRHKAHAKEVQQLMLQHRSLAVQLQVHVLGQLRACVESYHHPPPVLRHTITHLPACAHAVFTHGRPRNHYPRCPPLTLPTTV